MHFLIIGGDAAGMSAASRARRNDPDLKITVLEKTADVSYSACGMPYSLADPERDMTALVVREARVFREKQNINLLTGHTAETIDPRLRQVTGRTAAGESFAFDYDKLLLATGAAAIPPDVPGKDEAGVMTLKTLGDGKRLEAYLAVEKPQSALIIGMGYVGLEMAEALRQRGLTVTMVKPRTQLLPWLAEDLAAVVQAELTAQAVDLRPGFQLQRIERAGGGLAVVGNSDTLTVDLVVAAIGVTPNSQLAETAGLELGPHREICVNRQLQTSEPDIYAAGDCADAYQVVTGEKTWLPLALRANRAGRAVGDHVCGKAVDLPGIAGTAVFKVFGLAVARTGLNADEARRAGLDPASVVIKSRSRAHAHPGASDIHVQMVGDRTSGRLLGVQMVGREGVAHRINAPATALAANMTVADLAQCDLAYAPPFGPVWDPLLTAANQLLKKL